ncbi:MAG TPA: CDP-alcohol phosphatidyltransferase family protein, partial [Clostridia bacterium]|nr:CDP-alcohol phosphatidyltransferase family protein [Clostridia bacterium]
LLGSAALLFLQPLSARFLWVYTLCGLSDALDGYVARKTGNTSKAGAMLDSAADIAFIAVVLLVFIPFFSFAARIVYWIAGIAFIRLSSLVVGYIRYRTFAGLHTYANKAAGLLLFLFPFLYQICGIKDALYLMLMTASVSAVEEIAIQLTSSSLNRDVKSIFIDR